MRFPLVQILLLLSFGLSSQTALPQGSEFGQLLALFQKPGQEIPAPLARKYFGVEPREGFAALQTLRKGIETPGFVTLITHRGCAAGGVCEEGLITTFTHEGKPIDQAAHAHAYGDCSFMNLREEVYASDSLLIFRQCKTEEDCSGESEEKSEYVIMEWLPITPDGHFLPLISYDINLQRPHYHYSCRIFTEAEIARIPKQQLPFIRNEIFAAHGYIFTSEKWQRYFSATPWYKATLSQVDHLLSPLEKANIELLLAYEKK